MFYAMAERQSTSSSFSALCLAAGVAAAAGFALGFAVATRPTPQSGGQRSPGKLRLWGGAVGSEENTPAATPRSVLRQDSAMGSGLQLVLLLRSDVQLSTADVAIQASRVVLGHFKKLYKRSFPSLRAWEESGYPMKVLAVDSQNDMLLQQSAARALSLPTHTFASDRINKQRTVMAIGPAPSETLEHITGHLREVSI